MQNRYSSNRTQRERVRPTFVHRSAGNRHKSLLRKQRPDGSCHNQGKQAYPLGAADKFPPIYLRDSPFQKAAALQRCRPPLRRDRGSVQPLPRSATAKPPDCLSEGAQQYFSARRRWRQLPHSDSLEGPNASGQTLLIRKNREAPQRSPPHQLP